MSEALCASERLIEILLEEEFRRVRPAARPTATTRRGRVVARWLAAALLLLGLGVAIALNTPSRPTQPQPLPEGTHAADLAAVRSAQQMLAAEQRLAELLQAGRIPGVDRAVTFEQLSGWGYQHGVRGIPQDVLALDGSTVVMTGFMLPIDEVENIREFMLVRSLWSCCYGKPPDINGIVRAVMPAGRTTDYSFEPLKVIGTLRIGATEENGYCVDIYQLEIESLEVIKP